MKKRDINLIISLLAVAAIGFAALFLFSKDGKTVVITKNKEQVFKGSLYTNQEIDLGSNTVEIKDGKVDVVYGNCKNQVCVKHKKISKKGEQIICIPNKIIITIK